MMKKLLVLMLVLATGGLASAGLILDVVGNDISVVLQDGSNLVTFDLEVSVDGGTLNATGANLNPTGKAWNLAPKVAAASDMAYRVTAADFPFLGAEGLAAPAAVLSGLVVAPPAEGCWVILTSYGSDMLDGSKVTGEVARVFVPEPMSLMLLGLGGLFLRKRK
jgi:hypothetical protein